MKVRVVLARRVETCHNERMAEAPVAASSIEQPSALESRSERSAQRRITVQARPFSPPWNFLLPVAAAILVATLYAIASKPNGFIYDDHEVIENQYPANSISSVRQIFSEPHYINFPYYRPVTRASLAIQKAVVGSEPETFHLANAILAGCVVLAAYALLRRPAFGIAAGPALLAATWFVVHPVASECVYPAASGRETIQPTLLILISLWAYLHRGIGWHVLALGAFAAAMFSKEMAIVLPVVFLIADALALRGSAGGGSEAGGQLASTMKDASFVEDAPAAKVRRVNWRLCLARYMPILIIVGIYMVIRRGVLARRGGAGFVLDLQHHPLSPLMAMAYAIQVGIVPFAQLVYEPTAEVWWSPGRLAAGIVVVAMVAALAWKRAPASRKTLIFFAAWFVLVQLPTSRILLQEAPFSERYVFPALLAIAAAGAVLLSAPMSKRAAFFGMFGAILWTAGLAWMSVARAPFYADDRVFSEQWVATNPNSSNAHNGVALVAAQSGDLATALIEYRRSLQLDPHSSTALNNSANLLVDIAHRRYAAGDSDGADAALREAAEYYRRLLAIDPSDASALCNYGDLLGETGDVNRAIDCYRKAIAARPGYAQAHYHLAIGLYVIDQPAESKSEFETALRLRPDWPEALHDYLVRLNDDRSPSFRDPLRAAQIESRLSTLRLPTPASGTSTR